MSTHNLDSPGHIKLREKIRETLSPYYFLADYYAETDWHDSCYSAEDTEPEAFAIMVLLHNHRTWWHDDDYLGISQKVDHIMETIYRLWGESIIDEIIEELLNNHEESH